MKAILRNSVFFVFIIFATSCTAPLSILKLDPIDEQTDWFYGQQVVTDSINGIDFKVAFDRVVDGRYLFNLEIINNSNMPYLVDPVDYYANAFDAEKSLLVENNTLKAIDPEFVIEGLDKNIAKNEAKESNLTGLKLLGLGVDIASAVAVGTDDNPDNDWLHTDMFWAMSAEQDATRFETESLNVLRNEWSSTTLRKTTLKPGQSMQGVLFFPVNRTASFLTFYFPVDEKVVTVDYEQIEIDPRR